MRALKICTIALLSCMLFISLPASAASVTVSS